MHSHTFLHQGGHGHEGCCHSHEEPQTITAEQTVVLLGYMLEHNSSHAEEMHGIIHALEDQGKDDAAGVLEDALDLFKASNAKLEDALNLAREG